MGKSYNKSGHSKTYHTSAGIHRRTTRVDAHFDANKWITRQRDTRDKHNRYNNAQGKSHVNLDSLETEDTLMSIQHASAIWPRSDKVQYQYSYDEVAWTSSTSDFEDKAAKKGTQIFIALQATSALCLAATGVLAGDFSKFNDGMQSGAEHLSTTMDKDIVTTGTGSFLHKIGWYQSHARLPKLISNLGTAFDRSVNTALDTVYKQKYLLFSGDNDAPYEEPVHLTKRFEKTAEKAKKLEEFANNNVGKEIIHARVNAGFAGLASAIHVPQAMHGLHTMMETGELNGHLAGGGAAIIGFGVMAVDQAIESMRWESMKGKIAPDVKIDHKMGHNLVGYVAREQYVQDFAFKWLPSIFLSAKGGSYMWEASHMQSFSDMATHAVNSTGSVDAAAVALLASGAIFSGSAAYEFVEQNGKKVYHIGHKGAALTADAMQNATRSMRTEFKNELIRSYNHSANHNPVYSGHFQGLHYLSEKFPVQEIGAVELEALKNLSPYNNEAFINPDDYLDEKAKQAQQSEEPKETTLTFVSDNEQVDDISITQSSFDNDDEDIAPPSIIEPS